MHAAAAAAARGAARRLSTAAVPPPIPLLPASGLLAPYELALVGAPVSYGQPLAGTELAPAALRAAGLAPLVTSLGWRMRDTGDVPVPAPAAAAAAAAAGWRHAAGAVRNAAAVGAANERICAAACDAAEAGRFVLTVGGDHSVAMGSVAGVLTARPALGVVWVDAHADINAPETSPSGNIHGMPLAFLMRHFVDPAQVEGFGWLQRTPVLSASSLVYVGLRDLDAGEKRAIRALGIRAFTMRDVDRFGIGRVMDMALEHLLEGFPHGRPLHLSYDIDAVDPELAPATGTRVPGGLTLREAHYVAESLAESGLLGSLDMVEVNPALSRGARGGGGGGDGGGAPPAAADGTPPAGVHDDGAASTVTLALDLVASALGKSIL